MPYPEIGKEREWEKIIVSLLSGVVILFVEGMEECIYIDARTYPARDVAQPDKEKALRGSRDGFVETIVFNTALLRRRIRDENLIIEMKQIGAKSRTDIALCYMEGHTDPAFLSKIKEKLSGISIEALTVSQESSYEFGYAVKFLRIITLILTALSGLPGYIAGCLLYLGLLIFNKTISGRSYLYPFIPFHPGEIKKRLLRHQIR